MCFASSGTLAPFTGEEYAGQLATHKLWLMISDRSIYPEDKS